MTLDEFLEAYKAGWRAGAARQRLEDEAEEGRGMPSVKWDNVSGNLRKAIEKFHEQEERRRMLDD